MVARISIRCEHCNDGFDVRPDLRGGITNCPSCGKATQVEGTQDPLWNWVCAAGMIAGLGIGYVVSLANGPIAGSLVVVGWIAVGWLITRLL